MTRQPSLHYATKPRRKNDEAAIQRAVVEHMRFRATPGTLCLAIKNEGRRSAALGLEYKRQGMRPGAPDLLILVPGRPPLGLELKTVHGHLSPEQKYFALDWEAAGGIYIDAYGLSEALSALELNGAIRPDASRAKPLDTKRAA